MIKFCRFDKCRAVAVGTGIRPIEHCREHYVEVYGGEFEEWNVVIAHRDLGVDAEQLGVSCARTGQTIAAGPVWLDPVETSIAALVYGGFIEPLPGAKAPAKRSTEG